MEMKLQSFFQAFILLSLCLSAAAQNCRNHTFPGNETFRACVDHPVLNSSLHWTYYPSNATLTMACRWPSTTPNTWIAWAINPQRLSMIGAQALVAHYQNSTGVPRAYTCNVDTYATNLEESSLSFEVPALSATSVNKEITIFATLLLPAGGTTVNQVWQEGPLVGGSPASHRLTGDHRRSLGTLDLLPGAVGV